MASIVYLHSRGNPGFVPSISLPLFRAWILRAGPHVLSNTVTWRTPTESDDRPCEEDVSFFCHDVELLQKDLLEGQSKWQRMLLERKSQEITSKQRLSGNAF